MDILIQKKEGQRDSKKPSKLRLNEVVRSKMKIELLLFQTVLVTDFAISAGTLVFMPIRVLRLKPIKTARP